MSAPSPPVDYGRVVILAVISAVSSAIVGGTLAFLAATTSARIDAATSRVEIGKDIAALQHWREGVDGNAYGASDARADLRALCAYIDAVLLRVETSTIENRTRIIELEKQNYNFHLNGINAPAVHPPPVCN